MDSSAPPPAEEGAGTAGPAPSLHDSLRRIEREARAGLGAGVDALRALHRLVLADFALARLGLARAAVWLAVTVVFGASGWLLLMATLIALLREVIGLSWLAALAIATALSLAVTALGVWRMRHYFDLSRMDATRRQLHALGLGDMDDEDEDQGGGPAGPATGDDTGTPDAPSPAQADPATAEVDHDLDNRVRRAGP
ncbi:MAG: phage holin family protein [Pseudoxanthomonas sp.]